MKLIKRTNNTITILECTRSTEEAQLLAYDIEASYLYPDLQKLNVKVMMACILEIKMPKQIQLNR